MPTVVHARRRVTTAACPQMSRMNVGHRPAIHSPHRHPSRTAGFRRPRRPHGLRGLLTPRKPGPEGRPVEGSKQKGSLFGRGHAATARCGTGMGMPPCGGEPTRDNPAQSLIPAPRTNPGPPTLKQHPTHPLAWPSRFLGAAIRGPAQGVRVQQPGTFQRVAVSYPRLPAALAGVPPK